ncbi:hypothetical protein PHLH8_20880 [Pseudomonas sp. Pc102]|uniref:hypothetical protein n=1 Tax=Pseudomonas sp. Pc102 TaxID=2678261 RepID=UPI001BD00BA6|nr:hypothetical protein [Pseudomonas sp. Pc102]BBP82446.1 hypothetical protein PHLH8_20880 [Pseudomonas sp. Pc102]
MPAPENLDTQTPGENVAQETAPQYAARHKGGGKWLVVDVHGAQVGAFTGTKDEVAAEVARLLSGGLPMVAEEPAVAEKPKQPAAQAIDPKTLKAPVLTAEGWVCPAPKEG